MIYKIDICYKIGGLGSYEETSLHGYEENCYFFLGNNNGYKILVKSIEEDKVILEFDKKAKLILPNNSNIIELKKGETLKPFLPITPAPSYQITITDIRKEQKLYWS